MSLPSLWLVFITKKLSTTTVTYQYDRTTHDVSFIINSTKGETSDTVTFNGVKYGATITAPTVTAKTGYTFTGWDNTVETTVTANATYTAQFSLIEYTVTFVADGTIIGTETYTVENTTITEPSVPSKDYYTGVWESYSLTGGDVTVNAEYILLSKITHTPYLFRNQLIASHSGSNEVTVSVFLNIARFPFGIRGLFDNSVG